MGSRIVFAVVVVLCAASVSTARVPAASLCLRPAPAVTQLLQRGLKPSAHVRLRNVSAVRARGRFSGVVASGVYFVSANVGASRIATWAFSTSAYEKGHGAAFSVDRNARRVSVIGSLVSPQLLASWGVKTRTFGYAASRACAQK